MKKIKIIFFVLLFSTSVFSKGEISFRRQKEKILQEQQEEAQKVSTTVKISTRKTISNKEKAMRRAILDVAFSKLGTPYIYGASGNNGAFDCSSYVQYVYKKSLNVDLPRVSYQQAQAGKKATVRQLKAGDLIVFDTLGKNRISHIGIYIGDNQFVHASSGYKKVVISELSGYYAKKFEYGVKIL
ncbi:MAG: C40 family peptidase [Fusobacteriales bacterium]|jgi:cell wall-associated NlpC family hydrolase|nr:C40 family peptidase [Fusobacteriales bacterium]